ncbi:MAG: DNA-3-methyladenine glycosylase 2 family protein, partial [Methylobacteriaceae bacterium]|nr:DNA-3-methyladenine glycosylase 2 family protein [Methylobacteriaceae bacterium]
MVGQQVSTASAAAIGGRLTAALGEVSAARIDAVGDDVLREAGLSRAKIATVRALAEAVRHGALDLEALGALPADEAHRRLVALRGIGPWTADVYLLFCLGHPDAFPAGDLALQEAARDAFALSGRPSAPELA